MFVWRSIASGLIRRSPQLLEEYERQPLIWNPQVLDIEGRGLGERTHIDSGFWDRGPASSLGQWQESRCLDTDILQPMFGLCRGIQTPISEIDAAIHHTWSDLLPPQSYDLTCGWWGYFEADARPVMAMHAGYIFSS